MVRDRGTRYPVPGFRFPFPVSRFDGGFKWLGRSSLNQLWLRRW